MKPDGDKGYRRVVASPAPKQVLEARAIQVGTCLGFLQILGTVQLTLCTEAINSIGFPRSNARGQLLFQNDNLECQCQSQPACKGRCHSKMHRCIQWG
jgi:hypothetical protein